MTKRSPTPYPKTENEHDTLPETWLSLCPSPPSARELHTPHAASLCRYGASELKRSPTSSDHPILAPQPPEAAGIRELLGAVTTAHSLPTATPASPTSNTSPHSTPPTPGSTASPPNPTAVIRGLGRALVVKAIGTLADLKNSVPLPFPHSYLHQGRVLKDEDSVLTIPLPPLFSNYGPMWWGGMKRGWSVSNDNDKSPSPPHQKKAPRARPRRRP